MMKLFVIFILILAGVWLGFLMGTSSVRKEALNKGFAEYEVISGDYQWRPLVFFTSFHEEERIPQERDK